MNIWLINNYNMLPEHGHLNRNYYLGKQFSALGHTPIAFVGSHPHNSDLQLIDNSDNYRIYKEEPFPWVLIKTHNYKRNRKKQILSMFEFYRNMKIAAKHFCKPDVIIGSSAHPLAALLAIQLGKKYNCKKIVEIRDLWPESLIAYGLIGKNSIIALLMRHLEKWLYCNADSIVFTMGGGYDYIIDQHWDTLIPRTKVFQINNGVDLELFDNNRKDYQMADPDLDNPNTFKIVYTGSLRKANEQIFALFDAIKLMQGPLWEDYVFLIYGKGELIDYLRAECRDLNLSNVKIKGFVEKKYIPYVLSKCDVAILNSVSHDILRYGGSQNKQFDYFAAGISVITAEDNKYSIVKNKKCGIAKNFQEPEDLVDAIVTLRHNPIPYAHIRAVAEEYDYSQLAKKYLDIIENC